MATVRLALHDDADIEYGWLIDDSVPPLGELAGFYAETKTIDQEVLVWRFTLRVPDWTGDLTLPTAGQLHDERMNMPPPRRTPLIPDPETGETVVQFISYTVERDMVVGG